MNRSFCYKDFEAAESKNYKSSDVAVRHGQHPSWRITLVSPECIQVIFCLVLPCQYKRDDIINVNCSLIHHPCTTTELEVYNVTCHDIEKAVNDNFYCNERPTFSNSQTFLKIDPTLSSFVGKILKRNGHYTLNEKVKRDDHVCNLWCFKFTFNYNLSELMVKYVAKIKQKISTNNKKCIYMNINGDSKTMTKEQCWKFIERNICKKSSDSDDDNDSDHQQEEINIYDKKFDKFELLVNLEFDRYALENDGEDVDKKLFNQFEYKRNNILIGFAHIFSNYNTIRNLIGKELNFISHIVNLLFQYVEFKDLGLDSNYKPFVIKIKKKKRKTGRVRQMGFSRCLENDIICEEELTQKQVQGALDLYGFLLDNDAYLAKLYQWSTGIPQHLLNSCHDKYKINSLFKCDTIQSQDETIWYECCLMSKASCSVENCFIWINAENNLSDWKVDLMPRHVHWQPNKRKKSQLVKNKKCVQLDGIDVGRHYCNKWSVYLKEDYSERYSQYRLKPPEYHDPGCMYHVNWVGLDELDETIWLMNRIPFGNKILSMKKLNEKFYHSLIEILKYSSVIQISERKNKQMKHKKRQEYKQKLENNKKTSKK